MSAVATRGSDWDAASAVYDRQLWLERRAIRAAVDLSAVGARSAVLDAGTGTGAVLRELARREERPREAVGIDASAEMLARVPALPPGWRLVRARVEELPFPAGGFDVAFAAYLLHVLAPEERAAALGELHRVLAPGGRLVTVTPIAPRAFAAPLWQIAGRLSAGLAPLDPRMELVASGFELERARTARAGYPSLCVAAKRPPGQGTPE
jgi:ubiquinone/menaquinone biosynthesis C-methylase UbiE